MQELIERKKEQQKQEEKPSAHKPLSLSMSEGPMLSLSEGKKVEAHGRKSFEQSVKIELANILMRQKKKQLLQKGKGPEKKGKGGKGKDDFKDR